MKTKIESGDKGKVNERKIEKWNVGAGVAGMAGVAA